MMAYESPEDRPVEQQLVPDREVRKRLGDPRRREVELVERVGDLQQTYRREHADDKPPVGCVTRGAAGVSGTEVEPRADREQREDESDDVKRQFERLARRDEVPDVPTRPDGDREEEANQPFAGFGVSDVHSTRDGREACERREREDGNVREKDGIHRTTAIPSTPQPITVRMSPTAGVARAPIAPAAARLSRRCATVPASTDSPRSRRRGRPQCGRAAVRTTARRPP